MRCFPPGGRFLAGLLVALMFGVATPQIARAQPAGEVESIGFNNVYRPGCWTPMVVKIKPNDAASGTYLIQVKQRDLDNDTAVFTREISLTGSAQGGGREQRFWMYFIPQPVNRGLPDRATANLKDFQELIEVYLCNEAGKQITQLPITAGPDSVDPPAGNFESTRGTRLVLAVNDGNSRPAWDEYRAGLDSRNRLVGVMENLLMMPLRPRELPENPLAYEAVDAIVWFDADPTSLQSDGGLRQRALEEWVRQGGHLVICQTPNWQQTLGFGEMLPVQIEGVALRDDPEPLRSLAFSSKQRISYPEHWHRLKGPFRLAVATPKENAVVDEWMELPKDERNGNLFGRRPYIARKAYGCGAVTWVAQDLGDPAITLSAKTGWVNVWDRVLDLRNDAIAGDAIRRDDERAYANSAGVDFGSWLNKGLESKTRVGLFIALAIVFFIAYWLVAGPGVFFFLVSRKQTHLSWFGFAAVALAAAGLTVIVVRLLLRGPPELTHLTLVRTGASDDAIVRSRFGLYIPRDGSQDLELTKTGSERSVAAIAALPIHPTHLIGEVSTAGKLSYNVPVRDLSASGPPKVTIPYRSTLKQFQAWWAGPVERKIEGAATIDPNTRYGIDGRMTNGTGKDLKNVYIAYKVPQRGGRADEWMMYLPEWKADVTLDLLRKRGEIPFGQTVGNTGGPNYPGANLELYGRINQEWIEYWLKDLRSFAQMGEAPWDDPSGKSQRAFAMLSFFSRLPPAAIEEGKNSSRVEMLRRGARQLDMSAALAAGSVVVIAESADTESPMPLPLKVEGDEIPGSGRVLYQAVIPTKQVPLAADDQEQPPVENVEGPTTKPAG